MRYRKKKRENKEQKALVFKKERESEKIAAMPVDSR
jgi:hypothetical protein